MEQKEKLQKLEEMMDLDDNTLAPEMLLDAIEEWDSISHLSLIILLEDEFEKQISGQEIRALKTVQEILDLMN